MGLGSGTPPPRKSRLLETVEEIKNQEEYDDSPLAALIARLGGKGKAKIFREEPKAAGGWAYEDTFPVDQVAAESFEEQMKESFGGGSYKVRFYHGTKQIGEHRLFVMGPPKVTEATVKREGGAAPQTMAEFTATIAKVVKELLPPPAPASGISEKDFLKYVFEQQREQLGEYRRLTDRLLEGKATQATTAAAPPTTAETFRQIKDVVSLANEVRQLSDGGSTSPGGHDKGLMSLLLEGPVEKALTHGADRFVDRWIANEKKDETAQPQPAGPNLAKPLGGDPPPRLPKKTRPLTEEERLAWEQAAKQGGVAEVPKAPRAKAAMPDAMPPPGEKK